MKFTEAELIALENGRRHGEDEEFPRWLKLTFETSRTFERLIAFARASAVEPIAPFPALPEVRNGRNAGSQPKRKTC